MNKEHVAAIRDYLSAMRGKLELAKASELDLEQVLANGRTVGDLLEQWKFDVQGVERRLDFIEREGAA